MASNRRAGIDGLRISPGGCRDAAAVDAGVGRDGDPDRDAVTHAVAHRHPDAFAYTHTDADAGGGVG
jgi:hypothetical protein